MSRNYNVITVDTPANVGHFEDFLDALNNAFDYHSKEGKFINAFTYYWTNNDDKYVIVDNTQNIDPDKLMDAFYEWEYMDDDEDEELNITKYAFEKQEDFINHLATVIKNSKLYY